MRFVLSIDSGNAALTDAPGAEVAEILRNLASMAECVLDDIAAPDLAGGPVKDSNGNTVGRWEYVPEGADPALGDLC